MTLAGAVAARHEAAVAGCCDERYRLATRGGPRAAVLKGERLAGSGSRKICDCLVFRDDLKAAVVEPKHHSLDAGSIHEKLVNGGLEAARIAQAAGVRDVGPFFVVLAKSYGNRSAQRRTSGLEIKIAGKSYRVRTARCGLDLSAIVDV